MLLLWEIQMTHDAARTRAGKCPKNQATSAFGVH
jgi:hypothetical protein